MLQVLNSFVHRNCSAEAALSSVRSDQNLSIDLKKKIRMGSGGFEGVARPKFLRPQNSSILICFEGAWRPNWKMFFSKTIAAVGAAYI